MTEQRLVRFGGTAGGIAGILFIPLFIAAQIVPPLAGVPGTGVPDAIFLSELAAVEYAVEATALL